MNFEDIRNIDLKNKAWYLVKGENLSTSGYIIAQANQSVNGLVALIYKGNLINHQHVEGLIKLN
jgi:hypothetical protein